MKLASFHLILDPPRSLTMTVMRKQVMPYLEALVQLQLVLDRIQNRTHQKAPRIRLIQQRSPLSVSMEGVAEAAKVANELLTPNIREHAKTMRELEELEREAEIAAKQAEAEHARAKAQREATSAEVDALALDRERREIELERLRLENEERKVEIDKRRQEMLESRVRLALDIVDRMNIQPSPDQRTAFAFQLLQSLNVLTAGESALTDLHISG